MAKFIKKKVRPITIKGKEENSSKIARREVRPITIKEKEENSSKITRNKINPWRIFVGLISVIIDLTGLIILIIGIVQEYQVRQEYDFKGLSTSAKYVLRELAGYPNSMTLIIVGSVMTGYSILVNIGIAIYDRLSR